MINTTKGPMDESRLIKREGVIDNENERTETVEYCVIGCPGQAHRTGVPDAPGHFCNSHVHRSAHAYMKKNIAALGTTGRLS